MPEAWAKLVESEDDILVELLSDKVEDLCGVKPDPEYDPSWAKPWFPIGVFDGVPLPALLLSWPSTWPSR